MKKIAFIFGAGCEGNGQIGLPSGVEFQRNTILAKNAVSLARFFNNKEYGKERSFISWNSSSILYQSIKKNSETENAFFWNEKEKKTVTEYLDYKEGKISNREQCKRICDNFQKLYRENFYDKIIQEQFDYSEIDDNLKTLLEKGCFYSFADSLFNYLNDPLNYKHEVSKVVKLYYSAYDCILRGMSKAINDHDIDNITSNDNIRENRKRICKLADRLQQDIIKKYSNKNNCYYNIVKKILGEKAFVVTTNYTRFAEELIGLNSESIAYVHGRLDWFEDIKTKRVGFIDDFSVTDEIIPFIFVQSGIKPVVCSVQINELAKTVKMIEESDAVVILGYGVNKDDEHIANLLRERVRKGKTIYYFKHIDDGTDTERCLAETKKQIDSILFCSNDCISYCTDTDFETVIGGL